MEAECGACVAQKEDSLLLANRGEGVKRGERPRCSFINAAQHPSVVNAYLLEGLQGNLPVALPGDAAQPHGYEQAPCSLAPAAGGGAAGRGCAVAAVASAGANWRSHRAWVCKSTRECRQKGMKALSEIDPQVYSVPLSQKEHVRRKTDFQRNAKVLSLFQDQTGADETHKHILIPQRCCKIKGELDQRRRQTVI